MVEERSKERNTHRLSILLILTLLIIALLYLASLKGLSLLISAIAPGAFLMLYFYTKDRYDPEPRGLILKVFILGFFIAVPAAIIEYFTVSLEGTISRLFVDCFFGIALVEESLKFLIFYIEAYKKSEFDEPIDGIIYMVATSLGFATIENLSYVLAGGMLVAMLRAFFSVPGHALFGAIAGYYSGLAKFNPDRETGLLVRGLFQAIVYHGLFDFCILLEPALLILVVIPMMAWLIMRVRRSITKALDLSPYKGREEVPRGLLRRLEEAYKSGRISKETYEGIKRRLVETT